MPTPQVHTEIAIAAGATSATIIAGTSINDIYLVVALAFLGGSISHIWVQKMEFLKLLLSIVGSTTLGVVVALTSTGVVLAAANHYAPFLVHALTHAEIGGKIFVAFFVAFFAQKAVPIIFDWMDSKRGGNL